MGNTRFYWPISRLLLQCTVTDDSQTALAQFTSVMEDTLDQGQNRIEAT